MLRLEKKVKARQGPSSKVEARQINAWQEGILKDALFTGIVDRANLCVAVFRYFFLKLY